MDERTDGRTAHAVGRGGDGDGGAREEGKKYGDGIESHRCDGRAIEIPWRGRGVETLERSMRWGWSRMQGRGKVGPRKEGSDGEGRRRRTGR